MKLIITLALFATLGTGTIKMDCLAASHDGSVIRFVSGGKIYETIKRGGVETTNPIGSGDCSYLQQYAAAHNMTYKAY